MENILNNMSIVTLSISIWTGRKKLRPEDLKLADSSELPPEKLASLGSKRVMNPEALAPFAAFKQKAQRTVLGVGTRFLGGYAVPTEKLNPLMAELSKIGQEFNDAKEAFLAEYDNAVEDWIAQNPGWEKVIRNEEENVDYVRKRLSFAAQTFFVNPVPGHEEGLVTVVDGLADQLRLEVQQQAREAWKHSFEGKTEVGQKAVRPARALLDKMEGLVFLESGLSELIGGLKATLSGLPATGPIKGRDYAALCGVIQLLGNIPNAGDVPEPPEEEEEAPQPALMPIVPPVDQPPSLWF